MIITSKCCCFVLFAIVSTVANARLLGSDSRTDDSTPQTQQEKAVKQTYTRLTLLQINNQLDDLAKDHPNFVDVFTSQERYGLPSSCHKKEENHIGCTNKVMVIQDKTMYDHKNAKKAKKYIPDVFLSGALHGDERVGPVAMLETAKLLALAASCRAGVHDDTSECNDFTAKHGSANMDWMARLVSTRRIVILPTPNAKGYYSNRREELHWTPQTGNNYLDPNRDFAWDQDPNKCMQTIAGRTMNELFLDYLFQMSMTYHGGIEMITYEWGAASVPWRKISPDDKSQAIFSQGLARYAGKLEKNNYYQTGDMNNILYGVYGGMEDWVYASSWYKDWTAKCTPDTYGGYPKSKTTYDRATLSTFNILIEVSEDKNPQSSKYGTDKGLFDAPFNYNSDNGYASKNIRTALMSIDAVQPYVEISEFNNKALKSDIQPMRKLVKKWCTKVKKKGYKKKKGPVKVKWQVGGSFKVDETWLVYGSWKEFPKKFNCVDFLSESQMKDVLENTSGNFYGTSKQNGKTKWTDANSGDEPFYSATIDLSPFDKKESIAVYAVAMVDQDWTDQPNKSNIWPPNIPPQSHVVNARTNKTWKIEKEDIGKIVQGRLHWLSIPLTIKVK